MNTNTRQTSACDTRRRSHRQWLVRACLLVSLTFTLPVVAAQVYTWVDEHGKKHFGDRPDPGAADVSEETYQIINRDSGYPITDPDLHLDGKETYSERKQRERAEQQAVARARKEKMQGACSDARTRLSALQGPVAFFDDDGNPVAVTEKERQREEDELKSAIQKHCQ